MQRAPLVSVLPYALVASLMLAGAFSGAWADTSAPAAAPVLIVPGSQTVSEGQLLAFNVNATDADGQTVVLRTGTLPAGATFRDNRNNSGSFSWTPAMDQAGNYGVSITADDMFGGRDTKSVAIAVLNTNNAPEMNAIGNRTVERGSMVFVSLSGSDPDGDAISYSATGLPSYATLDDYGEGSGNLTLAPGPGTPIGVTAITVRLTDGSLSASETFDVTVVASATSSPPVLSAIGTQTVTEGEPRSVTLSASDPDGETLVWTVSIPGFANVVVTGNQAGQSTARLDLAPDYCEAGTYPASVTVSDGALDDSENFTISVADRNRAPVWTTTSEGLALSLGEGEAGSLAVAAADPDEACGAAPPTLSIHGSDAGDALVLSLSGQGSGTLHVTAAAGSAGSYHVTLRAVDPTSAGLFQDAVVLVTVRPSVGPPPAIEARAWLQNDPLRLWTGRPRVTVYLEPREASFSTHSIVLESIRLVGDGSGSVASIAPLPDDFAFDLDRDHNGVNELRMDFAKDDVRDLLAGLGDPGAASLTLTAQLTGGQTVTATLGPTVLPARQRNIRRIGPNPLNPEAVITVRTEQTGYLRVRIYDLNGRLVRTLLDASNMPAGERDLRFDGKDGESRKLASGRYFVRVETAEGNDSESLTILK